MRSLVRTGRENLEDILAFEIEALLALHQDLLD